MLKGWSWIDRIFLILILLALLVGCRVPTEPEKPTELNDTLQCPKPVVSQDSVAFVKFCK